MRITYIGDPHNGHDGPDRVMYRGIVFPKGVAVDVSDPATLAKLRANDHFESAAEQATVAEPRRRGRRAKNQG